MSARRTMAMAAIAIVAANPITMAQTPVESELNDLVNQIHQQNKPAAADKLRSDGGAAEKAADQASSQLKAKIDRDHAQILISIQAFTQQTLLKQPPAQTLGRDAAPIATTDAGGGGASGSAVAYNANCPRTLSYLDAKLPTYADPDLQQLRQAIVGIDVVDALGKAEAQGYSPKQAIAATVQQAHVADAALVQSGACVRAYSASPDAAMASLEQGTGTINGMGNAAAACSGAYVASYYAAVAMRETAIVMACLTN